LAENIKKASLCGLGQTAPNPVLSTLRHFREEYEEHIVEKKCRAGMCKDLLYYEIIDVCTGCGACKKVCPVNAIEGVKKEQHVISQDKCIKCGQCFTVCKFEAVKR
jgi:NADH-quinone oxidoreductase subunit F/NADP-reducing hydrogenase subunit HndC